MECTVQEISSTRDDLLQENDQWKTVRLCMKCTCIGDNQQRGDLLQENDNGNWEIWYEVYCIGDHKHSGNLLKENGQWKTGDYELHRGSLVKRRSPRKCVWYAPNVSSSKPIAGQYLSSPTVTIPIAIGKPGAPGMV